MYWGNYFAYEKLDLVLVGHNIPVRDLREDILIAITSLQSKAKQFPKINKGYVLMYILLDYAHIPDMLYVDMLGPRPGQI